MEGPAANESSPEDSKGGEDILSALESIPGVGSLRSVRVMSSSSLLSTSKVDDDHRKASTSSSSMASFKSPPSSALSSPSHKEEPPTAEAAKTPRPLPQIPLAQKTEDISLASKEEDLYDSLLETSEDGYCELNIPKALGVVNFNNNNNKNNTQNGSGYFLTMTGTVKRGRKLKDVDIHLDLSATQHLSVLERRVIRKYHDRCFCGFKRGVHVLALSLLSLPFMLLLRTLQAFFLGSMTWINLFIHFNEERSCLHCLASPFILLLYPFWIGPVTILLGLWGGFIQISWYFDSWLQELKNPDSGFFSWFCNKVINLPDCAPYQVVILPPLEQSQRGPVLPCSEASKGHSSLI